MAVPQAAAELVRDAKLMAHFATGVDDRPHVAPVWYAYDDGHLSVLTGGRKLANVRRNPRVAVSIQRDADGDAEWMVVLRGTARVVDDAERVNDAAKRIFRKYLGPDEAEWDDYYRQDFSEVDDSALLDVEVGSATHQRY